MTAQTTGTTIHEYFEVFEEAMERIREFIKEVYSTTPRNPQIDPNTPENNVGVFFDHNPSRKTAKRDDNTGFWSGTFIFRKDGDIIATAIGAENEADWFELFMSRTTPIDQRTPALPAEHDFSYIEGVESDYAHIYR